MTDALLEEDVPRLRAIARGYGIELLEIEECDARLNAPMGTSGLCATSRAVFFAPTASFEEVLHEMMHVVSTPPGFSHEDFPEEFLLLQFERSFARRLPSRLRAAVIEYQLHTEVSLLGEYAVLGFVEGYERTPQWRAGFTRARALGLIDGRGWTTGRAPNWTAALLEEAREASESLLLEEP